MQVLSKSNLQTIYNVGQTFTNGFDYIIYTSIVKVKCSKKTNFQISNKYIDMIDDNDLRIVCVIQQTLSTIDYSSLFCKYSYSNGNISIKVTEDLLYYTANLFHHNTYIDVAILLMAPKWSTKAVGLYRSLENA